MAFLYQDVSEASDHGLRYWTKGGRDPREYKAKLAASTTVYVGNLSFFTTEEQIWELFSKVGEVKRIIMGLNQVTKTPCGFCFVEYFTHEAAMDCVNVISGTRLDDRIIRADWDTGFEEGRQYGRGKTGGQVRDEYRTDFDPERGGAGRGGAFYDDRSHDHRDGGHRRGRGQGPRPYRPRSEDAGHQNDDSRPRESYGRYPDDRDRSRFDDRRSSQGSGGRRYDEPIREERDRFRDKEGDRDRFRDGDADRDRYRDRDSRRERDDRFDDRRREYSDRPMRDAFGRDIPPEALREKRDREGDDLAAERDPKRPKYY